jgi:hypothetical protein
MNLFALLTSALLLFSPQANSPVSHDPLSNTFVTASQSVLDNALATDIAADDDTFAAEMTLVKSSRDNLSSMASNDNEKEVTTNIDNLIFLISSCHIQSHDPARVSPCQARIRTSLNRLMTQINRHKSNGSWVAGPPA